MDYKFGNQMSELVKIMQVMGECTDDYLFVYDMTNDVYSISDRAVDTFALDKADFGNAEAVLKKVVYPGDWDFLKEDIMSLIEGKKNSHDLEYRWLGKDGEPLWISCRGKIVENEDDNIILVGRIAELGKQNKYDNVTGLRNELFLSQHYRNIQAEYKNQKGFLLIIGIDNFKGINEKYGQNKGNSILAKLASVIIEVIDKNDISDNAAIKVYRHRGDEFAINFHTSDDSFDLNNFAKKLYKNIRLYVDNLIEKYDYHLFFTISAGYYVFDMKCDDISIVLRNAKFALHSAKMNGKNICMEYNDDKYKEYIEKLDLQEELRYCIANGFQGFELYYQPIVKAEKGELRGAEALIRWTSSKYGFMSPVKFIPLLEESSLIIPLGKWIMKTAAIQCKEWKKYKPDFIMNINLSFVQILKSNLLKDAIEIIDEVGVPYDNIAFEVTESGQIEDSKIIRGVLEELAKRGFQMAIDDFGTGYSNFGYIKKLSFDIIKIDRLFVQSVNKDEMSYMLLKYVTDMVHNLGKKVCVEGVETDEELEKIKNLNPDCIQGYYYGKPMENNVFSQKFFEIAYSEH